MEHANMYLHHFEGVLSLSEQILRKGGFIKAQILRKFPSGFYCEE